MLKTNLSIGWAVIKEFGRYLLANPSEKRHANVGPLYLWEQKRAFQIQFLKNVGLEPDHYLLDIGCGTLRGGIPLINYLQPGHYFGIESRAKVLAEGEKELLETGLQDKNPVLIVTDKLASLKLEVHFDYIWAFSVLIHLSDDILDDCLSCVQQNLKPEGRFYANVGLGPRRESRWKWKGFPIVWRSWEFYQEQAKKHGLSVSNLGSLADMGHVSGLSSIDTQRMLVFKKESTKNTKEP